MAKLSSAELAKREDVIQKMKKNKRGLVKRYGSDAEKVMYGRATNIAKKVTETQMENLNLKELVRIALMQEKAGFSKEYDDNPALKGGQKNLPDGLQKSIIAKSANEDLDLGHEDNEPHMIKSELYRIGKYAMELYQMVDEFEGKGEVDFPAWWQSKITTSANNMVSAKHYLDFETKEPQIDAMVGVASSEEVIDDENALMEDEQAILDQVRNKLLGLFQPYGDFKILDMTMKGQNTGENFRLYSKSKGADWKGLETFMRNNPNFTIKHISKQTFDNPKAIDFSYTTSMIEDEIEEGLPKGYFKKATAELDESFEKLVGKLKKGGKSEKAAKAIAGAVASYKAKGGGKGPTAKQKARG